MLYTDPTSTDRDVLEALTTWRLQRARADQVPPYIVLPNALLYRIVEERPQTEGALRGLKGMGPGRLSKYGDELLAVLRPFPERPPRPPAPPSRAPEPWEEELGLWDDDEDAYASPRLSSPQTYRVVIEYTLDDAARRQLLRDISSPYGEVGPVLGGLRDALSNGPAQVSIRVEAERRA